MTGVVVRMTINQARGLSASDRARVAFICSRNVDTSRKSSGIIEVSALATAYRTRFRPDGPGRDDFSTNRHPAQGAESMIFSERFPLFGIMLQQLIPCRLLPV